MVDQWGFQPPFQRSERCVLCDWTTGRKLWYGYEESNLNLNVRSVPSFPLNDTRVKIWLARQASNLEPVGSEPTAPPVELRASGRPFAWYGVTGEN